MPTPVDKALNSRSAFLGFAGIVTAAAAWMIWGQDMFPAQGDPTGDPEKWSQDELYRWLDRRQLVPDSKASKEELLARVKIYLQKPSQS